MEGDFARKYPNMVHHVCITECMCLHVYTFICVHVCTLCYVYIHVYMYVQRVCMYGGHQIDSTKEGVYVVCIHLAPLKMYKLIID